MPKRKQVLEPRMDSRSRRTASKVALMQLQKLTNKGYADEPETLEILSDDEDDEVLQVEPPKKKYKLTHKKSSDGHDRDVLVLKTVGTFNSYNVDEETLNLDCWCEELSPAQIMHKKKVERQWEKLNKDIAKYLTNKVGQLVHSSDSYTAYDISASTISKSSNQPTPVSTFTEPIPTPSTSQSVIQPIKTPATNVKLVMDANSGVLLGTMLPTAILPAPTTLSATRSSSPMIKNKKNAMATTSKLIKISTDNLKQKDNTMTVISRIPKENVVDLTKEDSNKNASDAKEVTFNKMQGKTFPSLVVVARPLLNVTSFNAQRETLDTRVKTVLMYPPTKFTEWLMQQGLLRSEQTCVVHPNNKLKLGIYSDVRKFTVSGGYVWVSDCCPNKFVSVFKGSIFETTTFSSVVMLKLIYHWACQTLVQNVIQWVKVDNMYLKGMYTWLRSVCTVALHTHIPKLGGAGVKVEVGVISLGTTSHDGNQRQVKVEVLGVLETVTRRLRLRAVEPVDDNDRNYKKRFAKILESLVNWVHTDSYIITDLTVDKHTLSAMGFKYVHQATTNDSNSNNVIMEYLRKVVPRMFQNTLSLLSRHIIQQFLDELVWREWYGCTASSAFDNIIAHLAEQTKCEYGTNLVTRLNKVSVNPFRSWDIKLTKSMPTSGSSVLVTTTPASTVSLTATDNKLRQYTGKKLSVIKVLNPGLEKGVVLDSFYYGSLAGNNYVADFYPNEIKCTICSKKTCKNNIEIMEHIYLHAVNYKPGSGRPLQCRYCLSVFKQEDVLNSHIYSAHPIETKSGSMYNCLICCYRTKSVDAIHKHMGLTHVRYELPYKCEICGFRTSTQRDIVNHFYKVHAGCSQLQCPFCLKTTLIDKQQKRVPFASVFLHHIVKHLKKGAYKKCCHCTLSFLTKLEYNEHTTKMHLSMKGKHGLVKRMPKNGNACLVPLPRTSADDEEIDLKSLVIDIDSSLKCIECHEKLMSPMHFPAIQSCDNNCQFTTCCMKAMKNHKCKQLNATLPSVKLPFRMYCICGFSDDDGNALAKHLAVCERKSAYQSLESAKAATVTHSMLDVLGLVRKPEDPASSSKNKLQMVEETEAITTEPDIQIIESEDHVLLEDTAIDDVIDTLDKDIDMETDNTIQKDANAENNKSDEEIVANKDSIDDDDVTITSTSRIEVIQSDTEEEKEEQHENDTIKATDSKEQEASDESVPEVAEKETGDAPKSADSVTEKENNATEEHNDLSNNVDSDKESTNETDEPRVQKDSEELKETNEDEESRQSNLETTEKPDVAEETSLQMDVVADTTPQELDALNNTTEQ